jgi:hypothetical protein
MWLEMRGSASAEDGVTRKRCFDQVAAYRDPQNEQTENLEDSFQAKMRIKTATLEAPQNASG